MRCQDEPIEIGGVHEKADPRKVLAHTFNPGPFPFTAVRVRVDGVTVAQIGTPPNRPPDR
ncbi:MAG: hypothetical protein HY475_00040 [Candidatus Terrybacteria bacterium]|nr:hypothetical protein [Candidatus Terrybacteria bacterium]